MELVRQQGFEILVGKFRGIMRILDRGVVVAGEDESGLNIACYCLDWPGIAKHSSLLPSLEPLFTF